MSDATPILVLRDVSKRFIKTLDLAAKIGASLGANVREEIVQAVDGISFSIADGEVVALVGESGCGKSTLGRMVTGLLDPSGGTVFYHGIPRAQLNRRQALEIQIIFQDPFASLNPRMRVSQIIAEGPIIIGGISRREREALVEDLLSRVGLDPSLKNRLPHQFSGGQRQRIGIARALAVKPRFLVCDEPVAALDVSIQAQVLNLFMALREELALTYLFISHDLSVVQHISDRVAIMYLGRMVELAATPELFKQPNHPYTQALLAEMPTLEKRHHSYQPIAGEIPSPLDPPGGCHFHPRCPHALPRCCEQPPLLREIAPGRWSACHLNEQG